jgi:phage-Barnase-EndoU-ColicinE5/D-RelE like nuclease2
MSPTTVPDRTPPQRPKNVQCACMRDLYLAFEEIFLGSGGRIDSSCGHQILVFDHHFFHLAAVTVDGADRLFMKHEKEGILALTSGFGAYRIGESRSKHLRSAYLTLSEPDEVWEENPKSRSKWVYIKEFESSPYRFTIALVTDRPEEGSIIVPVSSFPCKRRDLKRWKQGKRIYP